jgi:hypothetical protein
MSLKTKETIHRLFSQLSRDLLADVPPEQRARYQSLFQQRAEELVASAADGAAPTAFTDLIGLGAQGLQSFDALGVSMPKSDFDEAVVPTQLHAAADLYSLYQHERMKVFQVAGVLLKLFHEGRMRIQRGPGARALYLIEKHIPLRYKKRDRLNAYRRVFNYAPRNAPPAGNAVVYRTFHRQYVAFVSAIAQYFRDMLIGQVIRGSQNIEQRPFGSQASIERLGTDLRWQLDRATYGNVVSLTLETTSFLNTVLEALETPDIKKAFDANTKWDVIEIVSTRHLGGTGQISQRAKMAEAGRQLLMYVADNPFKTNDFHLFQSEIQPFGKVAESWIAAYRMVPEGRGFRGVAPALKQILGIQRATQAA